MIKLCYGGTYTLAHNEFAALTELEKLRRMGHTVKLYRFKSGLGFVPVGSVWA